MKRVLALLLSVLMVLGASACAKGNKQEGIPISSSTTSTTTTPTTTPTEEVVISYAHNEIINRFLTRFVEVHNGAKIDTTTIRRGKDLTEYIVQINECNVTITDVSKKTFASGTRYALQITISGGTTEKMLDRMLTAFAAITVAADKGCSTESALAAKEYLEGLTKWDGPRSISECVVLQYYTPNLTGDGCRMDLYVTDPLVTDATTTTTTAQ